MRLDLGQVVYVRSESDGLARRLRRLARRCRLTSELLRRGSHARAHAGARAGGGAVLAARRARGGVACDRRSGRSDRPTPARALARGRRRRRGHVRAEHGAEARRASQPPATGGLPPLVGTPTTLSFPSAHASTAFAGALATRASGCRRRRCTRSPWVSPTRACTSACTTRPTCSPARCSARRWRGAAGARSEHAHRHRRHAQRRQVVAVQRADEGRRRGGELPVHDDRAERRRRAGARRAPGAGRRDRRRVGDRVGHDRLPRHRRARRRRARGRGARQPLPREHPRDGRDRARRARARRRERRSTPRAASTRCATSRRSRPSSCSPTSSRPSAASSASRARRAAASARRSPRRRG